MLNLNFNSAISGTISDKDGEGTGFDAVQPNTVGDQYAPSLIDLDTTTGTLNLIATNGSSTTNTLQNALQVGLNASNTFTVSTRISSPLTNLTTAPQQAGLFVGSDQDNYAKLAVVQTGSGLSLQLYKEEGGANSTSNVGQVKIDGASIKTLDLYLTGDKAANTITAAYRIDSNTAKPTVFSQSFKPSASKSAAFFGNATQTKAGILAFTKDAPAVPVTFNYFGIAQDVRINSQPSTAVAAAGYLTDSGAGYTDTRGYGWVASGTHKSLDMTSYARDRNRSGVAQKLDTLIHMQPAGATAAAWEYVVPNGTYSVRVSVGDQAGSGGVYDSQHTIRVEGVTAINRFQANSVQEYSLATATVNVSDGKLTVDAIGGTNTKINYLDIVNITPGKHPSITGSSTDSKGGLAYRDTAVTATFKIVTAGAGVATPLNTSNVQLYRTKDNYLVPGEVNTSGGGDIIAYQPNQLLDANTNYTFKVTKAVRDVIGDTFIPYSTTFNTGTETKVPLDGTVKFTKSLVYDNVNNGGAPISSLVISPDGTKLYAADLNGKLRRWNINSTNGSLSGLQTFTVGGAIVGLAFDPNNSNNLWISDNASLYPRPAEDFTGKILKLTLKAGTNFAADIQNYAVNLPRSAKDHLSNSLAFHDGKLYMTQGSNSAMGALDKAWNRQERLLSASVLEIDPGLTPPTGGFNVQTESYTTKAGQKTTGNYNPNSTNAPVKIYATGVRNAYDLVWHSNGKLYAPTNGSAAGGNSPDNPNTSVNEGLTSIGTQNDYLFKIEQGGYYGHPNPKQGNYILNGGNPTSGKDPAEVVKQTTSTGEVYAGYAVGTQPDPDYKGFAYDFGRDRSPNGVIEYKSNTFGGALKNKLLVVEYSGGDDILALTPDASGNISNGAVTQIVSGLNNPLDLTENTRNGNLYVAEMKEDGSSYYGQISLLKAS